MALSVIGAGFGRTGTMSLEHALNQLGFGPCYHMDEVIMRPERVDTWFRAIRGERLDWDAVFDGYRSAVDWPACTFWSELAARYPDAKIVLTIRDADAWYDSVMKTIPQASRGLAGSEPQ